MAKKIKKDRWIALPDDAEVQILIKPFSVLYLKTLPSDDQVNSSMMWDVFNAVVVDWKGFEDEDGKKLECNAKNKRTVAEQFSDVLSFVFSEAFAPLFLIFFN